MFLVHAVKVELTPRTRDVLAFVAKALKDGGFYQHKEALPDAMLAYLCPDDALACDQKGWLAYLRRKTEQGGQMIQLPSGRFTYHEDSEAFMRHLRLTLSEHTLRAEDVLLSNEHRSGTVLIFNMLYRWLHMIASEEGMKAEAISRALLKSLDAFRQYLCRHQMLENDERFNHFLSKHFESYLHHLETMLQARAWIYKNDSMIAAVKQDWKTVEDTFFAHIVAHLSFFDPSIRLDSSLNGPFSPSRISNTFYKTLCQTAGRETTATPLIRSQAYDTLWREVEERIPDKLKTKYKAHDECLHQLRRLLQQTARMRHLLSKLTELNLLSSWLWVCSGVIDLSQLAQALQQSP